MKNENQSPSAIDLKGGKTTNGLGSGMCFYGPFHEINYLKMLTNSKLKV